MAAVQPFSFHAFFDQYQVECGKLKTYSDQIGELAATELKKLNTELPIPDRSWQGLSRGYTYWKTDGDKTAYGETLKTRIRRFQSIRNCREVGNQQGKKLSEAQRLFSSSVETLKKIIGDHLTADDPDLKELGLRRVVQEHEIPEIAAPLMKTLKRTSALFESVNISYPHSIGDLECALQQRCAPFPEISIKGQQAIADFPNLPFNPKPLPIQALQNELNGKIENIKNLFEQERHQKIFEGLDGPPQNTSSAPPTQGEPDESPTDA